MRAQFQQFVRLALFSYFFILVDGHRTIPNDHPQTQLISRNQHQYWSPQNRLASQRMFLNVFWRTILVSGNPITPPSPSLWCVLQIQKANKGVNGGSWHSFRSVRNLASRFVWNYLEVQIKMWKLRGSQAIVRIYFAQHELKPWWHFKLPKEIVQSAKEMKVRQTRFPKWMMLENNLWKAGIDLPTGQRWSTSSQWKKK